MTSKEKEAYRKALLIKKKELVEKLSGFQTDSKEIETGIAQDLGDKAESSYTKEFLLSLSDTERKILVLIDDALKKIDKADFGNCQMCEKPIGSKRMAAIPWARHCISCQQKIEESEN